MKRTVFGGAAAAAALLILAGAVPAAPVITSITPAKTSANTGDTVDITGTGFGTMGDVIRFPGGADVNPSALIASGVRVVVPATWSGDVSVYSAGAWSNGVNHEISFSCANENWTTLPFAWRMNYRGAPGCDVDAATAALGHGYDAWQCASGFSANYVDTTRIAATRHDGVNCRYWSNSGWSPGTVAATTYWFTSHGILEADIGFNSQHFTWSTSGAAGSMDIQNVGTREEGYSIGLCGLYGAADSHKTMYGLSANGRTDQRTLDYDDQIGAEFIYPHTRPNFTWTTQPNWYGPVVPRNASDASGSYAPLPAYLNGNSTVYINFAGINNGDDCAAPHADEAFCLDGDAYPGFTYDGVWGPGTTAYWMNWALAVRGGRHTFGYVLDDSLLTPESNEADNAYSEQFVLSPYSLALYSPVYRYAPPARGSLAYPNCDGFEFNLGPAWWGCVGILTASASDDYDLRIHDDPPSSTDGYDDFEATSVASAGKSDFVLVNGHTGGGPWNSRWVGVNQYAAASAGPFYIQYCPSFASTIAPAVTPARTIPPYCVVGVEEFYLDPTGYWDVVLDNVDGSANLGVALYSSTGIHFGKSDCLAMADSNGGGQPEMLSYNITSPGWYGVVVFKNGSGDTPLSSTYQVTVRQSLPNLKPDPNAAGWDYPLVLRNDNTAVDGNAHVSAVLDGNTNDTYPSVTCTNDGFASAPHNHTRLYLDGFQFSWLDMPAIGPGARSFACMPDPFLARGGRHTVLWRNDWDGTVAESNEADNDYERQFVFSPLVLADDTPVVRYPPPDRGSGVYPNSDGFQYTGTSQFAWATALCPVGLADDYDLYVYDDYAGAQSGFSSLFGYSGLSSGLTDVVGGRFQTAGAHYPAVLRFEGGAGNFVIDACDAAPSHDIPGVPAVWNGEALPANRLVDVFEVYLTSGLSCQVEAQNVSGGADIVVGVFAPSMGVLVPHSTHLLMLDTNGPGGNEAGGFAATETGGFAFFVFKQGASDVPLDCVSNLRVSLSASGIETAEVPSAYGLGRNTPNPFSPQTTIRYEMPSPGGSVRIEIFDLAGRRVRTLVDASAPAGAHEAVWDGKGDAGEALGSGAYFYRMTAGSYQQTEKMLMLK